MTKQDETLLAYNGREKLSRIKGTAMTRLANQLQVGGGAFPRVILAST